MAGEIRTRASTSTFAGGRIPGSSYDFHQPALVSGAVGTLNAFAGPTSSLTILADGSATMSFTGCKATGRVTPRADGKNLLMLSMTIDPATCAGATSFTQFEGFILAYELAGGGRRMFAYVFGTDVLGWGGWEEYLLTGSQP